MTDKCIVCLLWHRRFLFLGTGTAAERDGEITTVAAERDFLLPDTSARSTNAWGGTGEVSISPPSRQQSCLCSDLSGLFSGTTTAESRTATTCRTEGAGVLFPGRGLRAGTPTSHIFTHPTEVTCCRAGQLRNHCNHQHLPDDVYKVITSQTRSSFSRTFCVEKETFIR